MCLPMSRAARNTPGGLVYHVLNRSVGKMPLFRKVADFEAFQRVMIEARERHPIRILSYRVLSNHWHFVVWPAADRQVTAFFRWGAHTRAMRWRVAHWTVGCGHVYQGRFKSFPVRSDEHLLSVLRYVEPYAVGAGLVERAERWHWSSLWARTHGDDAIKGILSPWPVQRPVDWTRRAHAALSARELGRLRVGVARGQPFGENEWVKRMARAHRLEHTVRPEGRPPKPKNELRPRFLLLRDPLLLAGHRHSHACTRLRVC
jgi:putative transposase